MEVGVAFASADVLKDMSGYGYGSVYDSWNAYYHGSQIMQVMPFIILIFMTVLIIMAAFSNYRKYMRWRIGSFLIKIWVEVKLLAAIGIGGLVFNLLEWQYMFMYRMPFDETHALCIAVILFWGYFTLCDLLNNGLDIFKVNTFTTLIKAGRSIYRSLNSKVREHGFQRIMRERLLAIAKVGIICGVVVSALILTGFFSASTALVVLGLFILGIGVIIISEMLVRFGRDYTQMVHDIGVIMEHIEKVVSEGTEEKLKLPGENLLEPLARNINLLQDSMKESLEQQISSERMKVELITNVSHDLKTPLTSIINYTDILLKENISPEYAGQYIRIINKKAVRLNVMVKDLFDVAKANSGNIDIDMQRLDLAEHIRQCMAEMDEYVASCSNEIRMSLPTEPVYIVADGQKLYRVFENLLVNAIKYSLENTRIYILVQQKDDEVRLTVKNVSSYEMDFSGIKRL